VVLSSLSLAPSIPSYEQRLIVVVMRHFLGPVMPFCCYHSGMSCFEVCGVVSDEVAGLGAFRVLTLWVLCYLGFLVPPWGL
jgi:hypothetical protein